MRGDGVKRAGRCGVGGYQGYQNIGRKRGSRRVQIVEKRLLLVVKKEGWFLDWKDSLLPADKETEKEERRDCEARRSSGCLDLHHFAAHEVVESDSNRAGGVRWACWEVRAYRVQRKGDSREDVVCGRVGRKEEGERQRRFQQKETIYVKCSEIQGDQSRTRVLLCDGWRLHWMYTHLLNQVTLFSTGNYIHQHHNKSKLRKLMWHACFNNMLYARNKDCMTVACAGVSLLCAPGHAGGVTLFKRCQDRCGG